MPSSSRFPKNHNKPQPGIMRFLCFSVCLGVPLLLCLLYFTDMTNNSPPFAAVVSPREVPGHQSGNRINKLSRNERIMTFIKVDGTSFQVFWICKLWKERTKSQLKVITKFVYDSITKLVLVQKRQLFCHQLLPWQRYLMIVQTYFWAWWPPIFFTLVSLSFENETTWSFKKISTKRIFYKR